MNAQDIERLLASKHSEDLFVAQCKTGSSQGYTQKKLGILDAWAMKRSWAHPNCTGYEIKVSRSDFVNDNKWTGYLPYCNSFYFVCPPKLISVDEVGPDAGLLWTSKTGTMLYTKKKAPYRDITVNEGIFIYILMCRASVGPDRFDRLKFNDAAYYKSFLSMKTEKQQDGHDIGRVIRTMVSKRCSEVESQNRILKSKMEHYDDIRHLLKELELTPDSVHSWGVRNEIRKRAASTQIYEDAISKAHSLCVALDQYTGQMEELLNTEKKPK